MMRIAMLLVWGPGELTVEEHNDHFRRFVAQPEVEIIRRGEGRAPECKAEVSYHMIDILDGIRQAEKEGYDAVVFVCHADIGIEEARALVRIPVVGVLQTAVHIGLTLGHRIGIINACPHDQTMDEYRIRALGLEHLVSSRSIGISSGEDMLSQRREYLETGKEGDVIERTLSTSIQAIEEDNASILIVGCGGMLWLPPIMRDRLKGKGYDIPIINPLPLAVEIAKALVNQGLSHSPICYPHAEGF